jgi:hypothetical protein
VPFDTGAGHEIPEIQAIAGPSPNGNLTVLFYANALNPVSAQLTFSGEVLPAPGRFVPELQTTVPWSRASPGGPDASIVSVTSTIGPSHLTYYKRVHGRLVPFRPQGVTVPERCPHGGLPSRRRIRLPGRRQHERLDDRPVPRAPPTVAARGQA